MKLLVLIGRILYSSIFILSSFKHFTSDSIHYAAQNGIQLAPFLVPLSGVIALIGGLSILLGYKARIGAWLIVIFLIPVTFMMHPFWGMKDPMTAMVQSAMFMKNLSLLGAALMITYFGSGPMSVGKS